MKTRVVRVCLGQFNATVGDIQANADRILCAIREAEKKKADLILFPELALTGYPPEDLLFKKKFVSDNIAALHAIARKSSTLAVLGFVDRDSAGRRYNAAAVLGRGRLFHAYHKLMLPNYGVFDEQRYFHPGQKGLVVGLGEHRFGLTICEDVWRTDSYLYRPEYAGTVSFLVNISASPYHRGKQKERVHMLQNLARSVRAPVFYLNLVGGQDELVFDGGSLVLDATGKVLLEAERFSEEMCLIDLPLKPPPKKPTHCGFVESLEIPSAGLAHSKKVFWAAKPKELTAEEEVYRALVLGTRDYVQKNGFRKVLVGVSGGIDSALVSAIAVDALGADAVVAVTMPSQHTSKETLRDSKMLARNLGLRCIEVSIKKLYAAYSRVLAPAFEGFREDSTEENLQARIRGNLLMALSNKFGYLVLTTGNKSEMATGYCTLYGDMAGGFATIKDVPKTLVFRLARFINRKKGRAIIPSSIITRAPSAELRPNQKDQDSLPPYPTLDAFLEKYIEKDEDLDAIAAEGFSKNLAVELARKVDGNEYKRRQAPPGVKITPKAFGRDRRMPITNRFKPLS